MAKSKIIKDLANGQVDLSVSLKRAKVLLNGFEKKEILQWVKYESEGYSDSVIIPEYRQIKGSLKGTFIVGYMQYSNADIPIVGMEREIRDTIETCYIRQSIETLKTALKNENASFGKPISPDWFNEFMRYSNIDMIVNASVQIDLTCILNIFSVVENKLIDIFLLLEKEFGCLDELDLDLTQKDSKEIEKIENNIYVTIFEDNSITIGDKNKIEESSFTTGD